MSEYSLKHDAVYCFTCHIFAVNSCHLEETFKTIGFKNGKKID